MYKVTLKQGYSTIECNFTNFESATIFVELALRNGTEILATIDYEEEGEE